MRHEHSIWDEMRIMQENMERLFNEFFRYEPWERNRLLPTNIEEKNLTTNKYRQALTDISETNKEIIATVELPGVEKKDIKINTTEEGIEIKVEKEQENKKENKKEGTYHYEKNYTGFYRFIPVPEETNTEKTKASYKNGVLELRIPKKESKKKTKQITID